MLHSINSFRVIDPLDVESILPIVKINNRKLDLVYYHDSKPNEHTYYKVAGYLEQCTCYEDSVSYDYGDNSSPKTDEIRVFIFDTQTNTGFEITNPGGEFENRLLRDSQRNHTL